MADVSEDRSMAGLKAGFIQFAETVFAGGYAPLYERLSLEISENSGLLAFAAETKAGQYPPYVLLAAVQYLLLADPTEPLADFYASLRKSPLTPDGAFVLFHEFCTRRKVEIRDLVSTRLVQTNEVRRSACLSPAFAYVARLVANAPLHLIEVGAAAGLNLLFDRYLLDYGQFEWGDPLSGVRIPCELRDATNLPLDGWHANVCHRIGVDLNPIDVTAESEARWLKALVWPDRPGGADLLDRAMAVAAQDPPRLLQGDAVTLLPNLLADVSTDEIPCVFQSYATEYFLEASKNRFNQVLDDFGTQRDLYFVEMGGPGEHGKVRLTFWRSGGRQMLQLAECSAHGQWLRWLVKSDGRSVP